MRSKTHAQPPSGFIPFRFLKLHPLSNIPLPERQAGTAWEPSKQKKKFLPPSNVVSFTISPHSPPSPVGQVTLHTISALAAERMWCCIISWSRSDIGFWSSVFINPGTVAVRRF
jgi:hypothetical protein